MARVGCLLTYGASGTLPRAGDLAHSLNHKSKGTTIPRKAGLANFQASHLPGEAVSPCLGPIAVWDFWRHKMGHVIKDMVQELRTFLKFLTLFSDAYSPVHTHPLAYPLL